MTKTYNIDNSMGQEIIWFEENGIRYSFIADPANSDYQAYLNKDNPDWKKENTTPIL